jgi:hypothetical protein
MDERTVRAEFAAARQHELRRRRVKRGVVAGYIHEISGRHRDAGESKRVGAALAPAPAEA